MRRLLLAVALAAASLAGAGAAGGAAQTPNAARFDGPEAVIELKDTVAPYQSPAADKSDTSAWYMFTAVNETNQPVIRVLYAAQPPGTGLAFFPRATRPTIQQLVSSHPGVLVESTNAYGRHAFRVTIPASASAPLAVRIANAPAPPSLLAWTEPALAAHNRQIAIFIAAVAGLIGAAAAIAAAAPINPATAEMKIAIWRL